MRSVWVGLVLLVSSGLTAVAADQTHNVKFESGASFAPGADEAMFVGSLQGTNEFSVNLPSDGNYKIQVYLMRNAARRNEDCKYSLTIEISG